MHSWKLETDEKVIKIKCTKLNIYVFKIPHHSISNNNVEISRKGLLRNR